MGFITHLFLVGGLLLIIPYAFQLGSAHGFNELAKEIDNAVKDGQSWDDLKPMGREPLAKCSSGLFWDGRINTTPVLIKIFSPNHEKYFTRESDAYTKLEAKKKKDIEKKGILPIHHLVKKPNNFYAIAMAPIDYTLANIVLEQQLTEMDLLLLLQKAIPILTYIHDKGIIHNNIRPASFASTARRVDGVTIIDFESASPTDSKVKYDHDHDKVLYASANYLAGERPTKKDDFESIAYLVADLGGSSQPSASQLTRKKSDRTKDFELNPEPCLTLECLKPFPNKNPIPGGNLAKKKPSDRGDLDPWNPEICADLNCFNPPPKVDPTPWHHRLARMKSTKESDQQLKDPVVVYEGLSGYTLPWHDFATREDVRTYKANRENLRNLSKLIKGEFLKKCVDAIVAETSQDEKKFNAKNILKQVDKAIGDKQKTEKSEKAIFSWAERKAEEKRQPKEAEKKIRAAAEAALKGKK